MTRSHLVRQQNATQSFAQGVQFGQAVTLAKQQRDFAVQQARLQRQQQIEDYQQQRQDALADEVRRHTFELQKTANQNAYEFRKDQWNMGIKNYSDYLNDIEAQSNEVLKPGNKQIYSPASIESAQKAVQEVQKRRSRLSANPGEVDFSKQYYNPYETLGLDTSSIDVRMEFDPAYLKAQELALQKTESEIKKNDALTVRALREPQGRGGGGGLSKTEQNTIRKAMVVGAQGISEMLAQPRYKKTGKKTVDNKTGKVTAVEWTGSKTDWNLPADKSTGYEGDQQIYSNKVLPAVLYLQDPDLTGDPALSSFVEKTAQRHKGLRTPKDFYEWAGTIRKAESVPELAPLAKKVRERLPIY